MRKDKTLLDDIEKIYFSIPCTNCRLCRECKNYKSCKTIAKLILSLKKHYKGDGIIQKIY